jgi:hypothetical protein
VPFFALLFFFVDSDEDDEDDDSEEPANEDDELSAATLAEKSPKCSAAVPMSSPCLRNLSMSLSMSPGPRARCGGR